MGLESTEVNSGMVKAIGYLEERKTLVVRFRNGREYHYFEVPRWLYEDLLMADSIGRFMQDFVMDVFEYKEET